MTSETTFSKPESAEAEPRYGAVPIVPATVEEIDGLLELLYLRPPAFWMRKISRQALTTFLRYGVKSPYAVILLARVPHASVPAGYVFAVFDPHRFWAGFASRHAAIALSILLHRVKRIMTLRRKTKLQARATDPNALPLFSWTYAAPENARIVGLYVRRDHRRKGIAMELYFKLFEALQNKKCAYVEEYMGPDYLEYAGKFPQVCGWKLQPCRCGGYKISRRL